MTQQELADITGMSVAGVRDIEQHRVLGPRSDTVRRLIWALGLSDVEVQRLRGAAARGRDLGAGRPRRDPARG
ncbi:transcriptional regulator with XRE-family HTH domain [Actinoalloteichus hymeniacidonis]|nr:transcriptional regulator with XRE-family HTH domain [Actinoalloteichus hymeniacidonis]